MVHPVFVVDVDALFLLNLVVDLIWLWGTSRVAGVAVPFWRLFVGAAVGAALTVLLSLPSTTALRGAVALALGTAIVLGATFFSRRAGQFFRLAVVFLCIGGAQAGVALLLAYPHGGPANGIAPETVIVVGLALFAVAGGTLRQMFRRRAAVSRNLRTLEIELAGQRVRLEALVDTGNQLVDPLTQTPAIVVEAGAVRRLLPAWAIRAVGSGRPALDGAPDEWLPRLRLLPFRAVGSESGLLLAFVPDGLALLHGGKRTQGQALVAVTSTPLHPDGLYQALLPESLADLEVVERHHA